MARYTLDGARTRVTIRTGTQGLFSPLAHDLELDSQGWTGGAELDGERWTLALEAPISGLRVVGVLKRGRLHDQVLSVQDRQDIERKLRDDLLAPLAIVRLEAEHGRLKIKGPSRSAEVEPRFTRSDAGGGAIAVDGAATLSLRALGIPEVKGPLGAFRVADAVQVTFQAVFAPAAD